MRGTAGLPGVSEAAVTEHDLCLAWNWEYDRDFADILEETCAGRGLSLLHATPDNLGEVLAALAQGEVGFRMLLDRASEDDERFLALVDWARAHAAHSINPYELAQRTWDKGKMHRAIFAEIHTPYTIVLPPFSTHPELPAVDFSPVGERFTIKPANRGGGEGVVVEAGTLEQVQQARQLFAEDSYLVQTQVVPATIGGRSAWFRVLYCAGEIFPFWWGTDDHVYHPVTVAQEAHYGLGRLRTITQSIARICGLALFSTEIALDRAGSFLVVDYVNDPIDLRLQSRCREGVSDEVVHFVAESLARLAASARRD